MSNSRWSVFVVRVQPSSCLVLLPPSGQKQQWLQLFKTSSSIFVFLIDLLWKSILIVCCWYLLPIQIHWSKTNLILQKKSDIKFHSWDQIRRSEGKPKWGARSLVHIFIGLRFHPPSDGIGTVSDLSHPENLAEDPDSLWHHVTGWNPEFLIPPSSKVSGSVWVMKMCWRRFQLQPKDFTFQS